MKHRIMIRSLPEAMAVVKEMNITSSDEWTGDYRGAARDAISSFLTDRMAQKLRFHLADREPGGVPDRRNGHYMRHLLTELGDVIVSVPRTRTFSPVEVIRAYARRSQDVDRLILASFLLGLSTRKVGEALLSILGEKISPSTVSRVAKGLDQAVTAFHRRRLKESYRALLFDGVVLIRKTGAGPVKRPVLVALGIRRDGKKEIIDFKLARSESANEWESFLVNLTRRGLMGKGTEVVSVDGGQGLRLSAHPPAALLGPQDAQYPRQGEKSGQGRGEEGSREGLRGKEHKRGTLCRQTMEYYLGEHISRSRKMLTGRSRRPAHLLWLCRQTLQEKDTDHQRNRTGLQGSAQKDEAHGGLREQDQHGADPLCRLSL